MAEVEWVQRFPNWDKIDQTPRGSEASGGRESGYYTCRSDRRRDEEVSTYGASRPA